MTEAEVARALAAAGLPAENTDKTAELRAELDARGLRWEDCPERYGRNADGRGMTLPATRFWAGDACYVATEEVACHVNTPLGLRTYTEMRVEATVPDGMSVLAAIGL